MCGLLFFFGINTLMKFKTLITEEGDFIFIFYISRPILLVRSKKLQVKNILCKLCDKVYYIQNNIAIEPLYPSFIYFI